MKRKILIVSLFIIFIILGILIKNGLTISFDKFVYNLLIKKNIITIILKTLTSLANLKMIVIYNVIILVYSLIKKKYGLILLPVNSSLSGLVNVIFKNIFKRERPNVLRLITETGYSYPSGHAMISILFFGSIIYLISKSNFKHKKIIISLILVYILLVGISRIYLGVHYFTDIMGGYLLGTTILLISSLCYEKLGEKK